MVVDWCMKYWSTLRLCGVDVESGHIVPCCPCDNSGTPPEGDHGSTYSGRRVSWGKPRIM